MDKIKELKEKLQRLQIDYTCLCEKYRDYAQLFRDKTSKDAAILYRTEKERDKWRARAEAMERAMEESARERDACSACKNRPLDDTLKCLGFLESNACFKFDEAGFKDATI